MSKKVIILDSGGLMSNQLWLFIGVYAYCLEKGFECVNRQFFVCSSDFSDNYANYFLVKREKSIFFEILFSKLVNKLSNILFKKSYVLLNILYDLYVKFYRFYKKDRLIFARDCNEIIYLPPTKDSSGKLRYLEEDRKDIYFNGWFFRNHNGLEKYRTEIIEYFKPKSEIQEEINNKIIKLRDDYSNIIGVHIRRGDYKNIKRGLYCVASQRINEILHEYLVVFGKNIENTYFIICSDEKIDLNYFKGLNISQNYGNSVSDLFLLSKTDLIIGSNSTYGAFASYYGNIPLFVCETGKMDWDYYIDKKIYFENKYCTFFNPLLSL